MNQPYKLISIPLSHYCEKVRWGMDLKGIEFTESPYLPVFQRIASKRVGGQGTVPVLLTGDKVLSDSTDILHFLDTVKESPRLYPTNEAERKDVEAMEELFNSKLGPATRRVFYYYALPDKKLLMKILKPMSPPKQHFVFGVSFFVLSRLMRKALNINIKGLMRSKERLSMTFDEVEKRLTDGRPFLCGDSLSAADITFAALGAPMVLPKNYHIPMPELSELHPDLADEIRRYQERPGGQFIFKLYNEQRRVNQESPIAQ
ncbi:MAG: glutathione S-transferase family protein [Planctomycetota bacterium]|nr:glutathione S-transferase family protein [Planctomycetota bacterium]